MEEQKITITARGLKLMTADNIRCLVPDTVSSSTQILSPNKTLVASEEELEASEIVLMTGDPLVNDYSPLESNVIYTLLSTTQHFNHGDFLAYTQQHPERHFILVAEEQVTNTRLFALIHSIPDSINIKLYSIAKPSGKLCHIGTICNIPGTTKVDENKQWWSKDYLDRMRTAPGWSDHKYHQWDQTLDPSCRWRNKDNVTVIGGRVDASLENVVNDELRLAGHTRITASDSYYELRYQTTIDDNATESICHRYGKHNIYSSNIKKEDIYPDAAPVCKETWDRVENELCSETMTQLQTGSYVSKNPVVRASRLVVSWTEGKRRRPTYHLISCFRTMDGIDVVELIRGEMRIKDMQPLSCYILNRDGTYVKVLRSMFDQCKKEIAAATVDKESVEKWMNREKTNTNLVNAVLVSEPKITLTDARLFGKLPFGALLLEQLIKTGHKTLARHIGQQILSQADNMNYTCGSLRDVFPNCDPEGTSLAKIFKTDKQGLALMIELAEDESPCLYVEAYKGIRKFTNNGVLNAVTKKLVEEYVYVTANFSPFYGIMSEKIDLSDHPEVVKSMYKMSQKIRILEDSSNIRVRQMYWEIVSGYLKIKEYGEDPTKYQVFLEFSTSGAPDKVEEMFRSREHIANAAEKLVYRKHHAEIYQKVEDAYASRKNTLKALLPTKKTINSKEYPLLKKYVIVVPSQIYGEEVADSIEREGRDMNHCVFRTYSDNISKGLYTVLYLRDATKPTKSLVTIGINDEGRINQTYAYDDNPISEEQAAAISQWAESTLKGKLTFCSEHRDIAPGGWPASMPIPSLGKPDFQWLQKLKTIVVTPTAEQTVTPVVEQN